MRLQKLFLLTTTLVLTSVAAMLLRNIAVEWKTYASVQHGLKAMDVAYLAMKAAEKASFERGPSIGIMGDGMGQNAEARAKLNTARDASNKALALAISAIVQGAVLEQTVPKTKLLTAQTKLDVARKKVESVAALAANERPNNAAMNAIDNMFDVVETIFEAVTLLSTQAEITYPELSDVLTSARLAAEMREVTGRLGSQFTNAISSQTMLGDRELKNITRLHAQIEQLLRLIEIRTSTRQSDSKTASAMANLKARYFDIGLPFIEELTAIGKKDGQYKMTTPEFIVRYVPEMKSIVELRDVMINEAIAGGLKKHRAARLALGLNITLGVTVFLIEISVFLMIRRRILKPLIETTRLLNALTSERPSFLAAAIDSKRSDEIGDMQRAACTLQDLIRQKTDLELDRERLIAQLQSVAKFDHLTGLFNRRAFADAAKERIEKSIEQQWHASIIIFDIDHFKLINDRYGHPTGDHVLSEIAKIAQSVCRSTDTVCRYGGEEFIVIAQDCGSETAQLLAERLRTAIAQKKFAVEDGRSIHATASFGVSTVAVTRYQDLAMLIKQADRALYEAKETGRNVVRVSQCAVHSRDLLVPVHII